nr:hypothetical protein [Tanacetum cinerariifolium]
MEVHGRISGKWWEVAGVGGSGVEVFGGKTGGSEAFETAIKFYDVKFELNSYNVVALRGSEAFETAIKFYDVKFELNSYNVVALRTLRRLKPTKK